MTEADDLPPIGAPATRALHAAGFTRLEQVAGVPECELAQLHGVGSKALRLLREALADRGLSFRLMPGPDSGGMDPVDVALRNETYRLFVTLGRAPTATETGAAVQWNGPGGAGGLAAAARGTRPGARLRRRADPHGQPVLRRPYGLPGECCRALVVRQLCMGRLRHLRGPAHRRPDRDLCADCGKSVRVAVDGGRPHDGSLLFHCLVPARQWWDDITFT